MHSTTTMDTNLARRSDRGARAARVEMAAGALTLAVGFVGIAVLLFAPLGGTFGTGGVVSEPQSNVSMGLSPLAVVLLSIAIVALVGVAGGAYLDARRQSHLGRAIVILSALLLLVGAVGSNYGALFLAPALLCGVATAIAAAVQTVASALDSLVPDGQRDR